jgi:hypothetical protein
MNPITQRANHNYNVRNDVERKVNYFIAAAAGIILGAMLALGV